MLNSVLFHCVISSSGPSSLSRRRSSRSLQLLSSGPCSRSPNQRQEGHHFKSSFPTSGRPRVGIELNKVSRMLFRYNSKLLILWSVILFIVRFLFALCSDVFPHSFSDVLLIMYYYSWFLVSPLVASSFSLLS